MSLDLEKRPGGGFIGEGGCPIGQKGKGGRQLMGGGEGVCQER